MNALTWFAVSSPAFASFPLREHGLEWIHPQFPLAHPLDDGTSAVVYRSIPRTSADLEADGAAYRRVIGSVVEAWPNIERSVLGPPSIPYHPFALARFGLKALQPAEQLARRAFARPQTRALFAGIAAHGMLPLDRRPSASFALVLGAMAHIAGWLVPRGGAQKLTDALAAYLRSLGGEIAVDSPIESTAIDRKSTRLNSSH